jgi:hypothetical protein
MVRTTMPNGSQGSGTGFFGEVAAPSIVLTNAHVIGMVSPDSPRPSKIEVVLHSGEDVEKTVPAHILAIDTFSDLAVLDVGNVAGLPGALPVRTTEGLQQLDRLYTFGFPFGEALGKEITIRATSVSALRKRPDGELNRIQVDGGIDPGNSGGPVVDGNGHVVGVAVSAIPGRQIKFAIPAERVRTLLYGRIASASVGQPIKSGDSLNLPVTIEMLDPRSQIREVAMEVWTGNPGAKRPASTARPTAQPGDSERERIRLSYNEGIGRGELTLPAMPQGKVIWLQPTWVRTNGETVWASASTYQPGPPLQRKDVALQARYNAGTARRMLLSVVDRLRVGAEEDAEVMVLSTQAAFQESVVSSSSSGVNLQLGFQNASETLIGPDHKPAKSPRIDPVRKYLSALLVDVKVDGGGNYRSSELKRTREDVGDHAPLISFQESIRMGLEGALLPLPNRTLSTGQTWKVVRTVIMGLPGVSGKMDLDLTCTLTGVRDNAGREEAVISARGPLRTNDSTGRARGMMIVDVATGTVRSVAMNLDVDLSRYIPQLLGADQQGIKVHALLAIRLERAR